MAKMHDLEIAHSAYLIGKARARLMHQKREQRLIAGSSDMRFVADQAAIIDTMEARLAALLHAHCGLTNRYAAGDPANTE